MGLLKWFIGYEAAKSLLRASRPQPVNIHLHIELPEKEDDGDEMEDDEEYKDEACGDSCPGDGIYVREDARGHTRFYDRDGRETDENGKGL